MNGDNGSAVLRTSPEALRAYELEHPMYRGFGEYLQRQGKLELTDEHEIDNG